MKNIWLYHINPKSAYGYTYGWTPERPESILNSTDREWSSGKMFKLVAVGDFICVYMKNIGEKADGVYVVGTVVTIAPDKAMFSWRPDRKRSARTLMFPILTKTIKKFFPRSFGPSIQLLDAGKQQKWMHLLGLGEVTNGVPRIKSRKPPQSTKPPTSDPKASLEHGQLGEKHVLEILRERYKPSTSHKVLHVSAKNPGSDHDIAVVKNGVTIRYVEVKTRVGKPSDPVLISEREIQCRKSNPNRHSIFIVYLGTKSKIRGVMEIDSSGKFDLKPRQHWLFPGTP